jgi:hypothetical protein
LCNNHVFDALNPEGMTSRSEFAIRHQKGWFHLESPVLSADCWWSRIDKSQMVICLVNSMSETAYSADYHRKSIESSSNCEARHWPDEPQGSFGLDSAPVKTTCPSLVATSNWWSKSRWTNTAVTRLSQHETHHDSRNSTTGFAAGWWSCFPLRGIFIIGYPKTIANIIIKESALVSGDDVVPVILRVCPGISQHLETQSHTGLCQFTCQGVGNPTESLQYITNRWYMTTRCCGRNLQGLCNCAQQYSWIVSEHWPNWRVDVISIGSPGMFFISQLLLPASDFLNPMKDRRTRVCIWVRHILKAE